MEAYEILKSLREKKGLTQEQLAQKVLVYCHPVYLTYMQSTS